MQCRHLCLKSVCSPPSGIQDAKPIRELAGPRGFNKTLIPFKLMAMKMGVVKMQSDWPNLGEAQPKCKPH